MNWWRTEIGYASVDGCWRFDVASTPQPACVLATMTPSPTPASTSVPTATVAATQTPTNPDCQGIPAAQDMQISPGNCEPAGTDFSFMGSGFQPSEDVRIFVTMPDGTLLGAPYILHADNSGDAGPVPFNTDTTYPTGLWRMTFEGQTSQHQAIGPFMMLASEPPPKR
jgi:hypothetical protein